MPPSADARGLVRFRSSVLSFSSEVGPLPADECFELPDPTDPVADMEVDKGDDEEDPANEEARRSRRGPNTDSRCLPRPRNAPAHATECDAVPHAAFRTVSSRTLMRKAAWLLR